MRVLRLRLLNTNQYRILVHLDTTQTLEDGTPNPRYLYELRWPPKPDGITHAAYLQQERPAIRAECVAALQQLTATEGAPLPGEGDTL